MLIRKEHLLVTTCSIRLDENRLKWLVCTNFYVMNDKIYLNLLEAEATSIHSQLKMYDMNGKTI